MVNELLFQHSLVLNKTCAWPVVGLERPEASCQCWFWFLVGSLTAESPINRPISMYVYKLGGSTSCSPGKGGLTADY